MKRITFVTAVASVALAAVGVAPAVHAADLMVSPPPTAPMAMASPTNIYVLLYGGLAAGGTMNWYDGGDPDGYLDLDHGWAFGGALGVQTPIDGVSIEGDLFHTYRGEVADDDDVDGPSESASTTSLMANLKYTAHLNDMFDLYGGAGIGGIYLSYDDEGDLYTGWGLGYQVMVGVSAQVADHFSVFGELRYQSTFNPIDVGDGYSIDAPVAAALVGLKISM